MAMAGQEPMELINRHRSVTGATWMPRIGPQRSGHHPRRARPLAYTLKDDVRVWIITEADHSATTILLPDEY